jgi:hypothetical protein
MTMAEFNIRLFSFNRIREREEMLFREVSYYSMIGSHLDPKKIPKSKQKFWSLGYEKKIEKDRLEAMRKAMYNAVNTYKNRNNV